MSLVSQWIAADVRAGRRAIIDRFMAADALSPQRTLALPAESLSADEQSLLLDFVSRGVVVACRGEYYLDPDALARLRRGPTIEAIAGIVAVIGIVGAMLWYLSGHR